MSEKVAEVVTAMMLMRYGGHWPLALLPLLPALQCIQCTHGISVSRVRGHAYLDFGNDGAPVTRGVIVLVESIDGPIATSASSANHPTQKGRRVLTNLSRFPAHQLATW